MNRTLLAVTVATSLFTPELVRAQTPAGVSSPVSRSITVVPIASDPRPFVATPWQPSVVASQSWSQPRPHPVARGIVGGVLGGIGGFIVGGGVGASFEPACHCDY